MENNVNIGGKARSLNVLKKLGFNVPKFVVLDAQCIEKHASDAVSLQDILAQFSGNISVRSSPIVSMPGLMETKLNLPTNVELISKVIKQVVESYDSRNAVLYRKIHNLKDVPPAVILQEMVYGTGTKSGAGVWFSRDNLGNFSTETYEYKKNTFGDAIVNNAFDIEDFDLLDVQHIDILSHAAELLEKIEKAAVEIEFTISDGVVWLLQYRKLTIPDKLAQCKIVHDLYPTEDVQDEIEKIFSSGSVFKVDNDSIPVYRGAGISPGLVTGIVGEDILVSDKITNELLHEIFKSRAVITKSGGKTAHISIQCRNYNLPYIIVPEFDTESMLGKTITLDGSSGAVYLESTLIEINKTNYHHYV